MTVFLVLGGIGLVMVLASLVLGDVFGGLFYVLNLDVGGGVVSAPVIGSFLAAFGFGGALTMYAAGVGVGAGALAGLGTGGAIGGVALALMRSLMDMPTDPTPRATDVLGTRGTVVTDIPEHGYGEVSLRQHGTTTKSNARATEGVVAGESVEVVEVLSASSVLVRPLAEDALANEL